MHENIINNKANKKKTFYKILLYGIVQKLKNHFLLQQVLED